MKQTNWAHWIAGQVGVVPLSLGIPGVAKSACHRALAAATGRRYLPCLLDQQLPEDLGGYPVPRTIEINGQTHDCVRKLLDETMLRAQEEPSVVLIDELTNVSHSMQAAALQWINEPSPHAWMFAAANPVDKAAAGVDLAPPMVNRLCVLNWERPREARRQGWKNGFRDYPAPEFPIVPETYLDDFGPYWGALLCQFEDAYPELFDEEAFPKDPAKASEPYPSDRSWTNVGRLLAAADAVGASPGVKHQLIAGCVGTPAAAQFERWLVEQKLPNPRDVLAAPHELKLLPRFDMNRALIAGVLGVVRAENEPRIWEAAFDVLEVAYQQQPEVALSAEGSLGPPSRRGMSRASVTAGRRPKCES
jgi:hypothetical protein